MSIIIEGMDMPKCCGSCEFNNGYRCTRTKTVIDRDDEYQERLSDCPLREESKEWIPVSKKLPEEDGDYYVTLANGVITTLGYSTTQRTTYPKGFYYVSDGFSWRQTVNPVVAWMPLPDPWEGDE